MAVLNNNYEAPEDFMSYGVKDVLSFFTDSSPLKKLKKIAKEDPANLSVESIPDGLTDEDLDKFADWVDTQPQQDLEGFLSWVDDQQDAPETVDIKRVLQTTPEEDEKDPPAPDLDQEATDPTGQEEKSSAPTTTQEGEVTPTQQKLFDLFQSKQPKQEQKDSRDALFVPDSPLINGSLKDYASYFLYSLLTGQRIDPDVWMKHSRGIKDVVVSAEDPKYDIKSFLQDLTGGMEELMKDAGITVPVPQQQSVSAAGDSIDVSDELLKEEEEAPPAPQETPAPDLDEKVPAEVNEFLDTFLAVQKEQDPEKKAKMQEYLKEYRDELSGTEKGQKTLKTISSQVEKMQKTKKEPPAPAIQEEAPDLDQEAIPDQQEEKKEET